MVAAMDVPIMANAWLVKEMMTVLGMAPEAFSTWRTNGMVDA